MAADSLQELSLSGVTHCPEFPPFTLINTYGACARGGGRRPGYEAIRTYTRSILLAIAVKGTLRTSRMGRAVQSTAEVCIGHAR